MKVLVIQENGRHDANRKFRECYSLQRAFKNLNHECDIWGLGHSNYETPPDFNSYDLIFNLENYTEEWLPNLAQIKNPMKIMWSIDSHVRGTEVFEEIYRRSNYDYLLHAILDHVKDKHHIWFPIGYDESLIKPMGVEKTIDFGFCGNFCNREPVLRWLEKDHNLHLDIFVIGDKMVETINSYKCHFNLSVANDMNYRSFETLGCKTLLMTNGNHQYDKLGLVDGENCLLYDATENLPVFFKRQRLEDKINQFREMSDDEIDKVANKGHEFVKDHTITKRVEKLLGDLK